MLNVRIRLGYRLLKSNTHTLSCTPGRGSSTWPPACAANTRASSLRTLGATIRRLLQLGEIQKIERRDARRDTIRRHAGELAARHRKRDQIQFLADLEREPRIGARVQREARKIVFVALHDLADAIVRVAFQRFAFAEHFARNGVERIVVEAHERAADQIDAVEHETAREYSRCRCRSSRARAARAARPHRGRVRTDAARAARFCASTDRSKSTTFQPGQHIGVEFDHAFAERIDRRAFVDARDRFLRHRRGPPGRR